MATNRVTNDSSVVEIWKTSGKHNNKQVCVSKKMKLKTREKQKNTKEERAMVQDESRLKHELWNQFPITAIRCHWSRLDRYHQILLNSHTHTLFARYISIAITYYSTPEKSSFLGITSFKKGISPNVGKSQVNFHPAPDISQPDVVYQRVIRGRTDLKYRSNASEGHRPVKILFTIRNLGQDKNVLTNSVEKTAIISDAGKQDTGSSNEYQTIANSTQEWETETGIPLESSTTESISTESMETGKEKATDVPTELPYAPELPYEPLESFGYNELQQQHISSTFSTFLPQPLTVSASTQPQELVFSSYPNQPKSGKQESTDMIKIDDVSPEAISLPDATPSELTSSFINNNILSSTVDALSSKTTKKKKTSGFLETHEPSENLYGSNLTPETSAHINESYPDLSTNAVPSLIVTSDISMNPSAANASTEYSGDRTIDVSFSSSDKQFVKPRIQSLLPFHFSMRNGTFVSNNASSDKQMFFKQETIPESSSYFGSNADKSNSNATSVVTTDKQTFAPTTTSQGTFMHESHHNASVDEIPNVTNKEETFNNFGPETDDLQSGYDPEQQSSLDGGYHQEEGYSFYDLDTKDGSDNIAEIDEENSQISDIYSTKVLPSYQNKEVSEYSKVPVQLSKKEISEEEQNNEITTNSDLHPPSIAFYSASFYTMTTPSPPTTDEFNEVTGEGLLKPTEYSADIVAKYSATDITSGTTQPSTMITEIEPEALKEIYEIEQTKSSSLSYSQFTPSNEISSSNPDSTEITPSVFPQMTEEMSSTNMITPTSILAGIHRTEVPVKEITDDGHATLMNWLVTSSMKLGESNQHFILPIFDLKTGVSDSSGLIIDTSAIREEESSETIDVSTSTFPENTQSPSSTPLSVVTEIPPTAVVVQDERTVIDHLRSTEDSNVNAPLRVDKETSEGLMKAVSIYPKKLNENEQESAAGDYAHHQNSESNTEAETPPDQLPSGAASERKTETTRNEKKFIDNAIIPTIFPSIPTVQNRYVSISPGYDTLGLAEVNQLRFIPQPLPPQLPNSMKSPYIAQPFNPIPYQSYIPLNPIYTGLPKVPVQSAQPFSTQTSMFDLKSDQKCCDSNSSSGYSSCGDGFTTDCSSPYCLLLPCKLATFIIQMFDHSEQLLLLSVSDLLLSILFSAMSSAVLLIKCTNPLLEKSDYLSNIYRMKGCRGQLSEEQENDKQMGVTMITTLLVCPTHYCYAFCKLFILPEEIYTL
uniref:Protein MGA2 n=1 Tax=Elaeophora elaphi TaxID=1147741 RepID=A0A158Q829_9BILA